jgi:hypothetical protein
MESKTKELNFWIDEQLRYGHVPRLYEVREYAKEANLGLKKNEINSILRLHPMYYMNMPQQRQPHRNRKYRPIVVNDLGYWHCDIGYFSINKRYPTPPSYRAGYLVAKDVLSRQVYATPLIKTKSAESIIKAFKILIREHSQLHPWTSIKSISFDRETSVVGKKVQQYLKDQGISFHAFQMSDSKAKHAECAIRLIRTVMARLLRLDNPKDRWWNLLPKVVNILNSQTVVVGGRALKFAPKDVNISTIEEFKRNLFEAAPAYYWAQFEIAPDWLDFKYKKGMLVRAKKIAVSSATIGNKTSEINLTEDLFVIQELVPYVARNMSLQKAYKCQHVDYDNYVEVFQEDEITPSI